ncbi:hypothetical protein ACFL1Z_08005, partial [Thermodesulfobacteriota bacterium]
MHSILKHFQTSVMSSYILHLAILSLVFTLLSCNSSDSPPATFTISGTITAPANTAVDSDVNDISTPYDPDFDSNNSFSDAQPIPNPVTLGGFVNQPNSGNPQGRFFETGDTSDFYEITLKSGDRVTIYIADSDVADLDLFLYNTAQNTVDDSHGNDYSETVIAQSDGNFALEVRAMRGASNYTLIINSSTAMANSGILTLRDDFVPGDIVVKFTEDVQFHSMSTRAASFGMTHKKGIAGRAQLFAVENDSQVE